MEWVSSKQFTQQSSIDFCLVSSELEPFIIHLYCQLLSLTIKLLALKLYYQDVKIIELLEDTGNSITHY